VLEPSQPHFFLMFYFPNKKREGKFGFIFVF